MNQEPETVTLSLGIGEGSHSLLLDDRVEQIQQYEDTHPAVRGIADLKELNRMELYLTSVSQTSSSSHESSRHREKTKSADEWNCWKLRRLLNLLKLEMNRLGVNSELVAIRIDQISLMIGVNVFHIKASKIDSTMTLSIGRRALLMDPVHTDKMQCEKTSKQHYISNWK